MNLQEKINEFIEFKEYSDLQVMIKGKSVKKEYFSYIHDKNIPLVERVRFWIQCPQLFKTIETLHNLKNNELFSRFISTLNAYDIFFNESLEIGLYLNNFFDQNKINGLFFEMTHDEAYQFLEFLLDKNVFLVTK